jgi:hypothetical protein
VEVDSFKYLPRLIEVFYKMNKREPEYPIPWTPVVKPLRACKFGLVTSAGLYHKGSEPPFDVEREKRKPSWGDPTYRTIPVDIPQAELGASHLHINTRDVLEDINILLPVDRFRELTAEGRIGDLVEKAYSFMGYQGYPPDTSAWRERYAPEVAQKFKDEGVDCVFLTPA